MMNFNFIIIGKLCSDGLGFNLFEVPIPWCSKCLNLSNIFEEGKVVIYFFS